MQTCGPCCELRARLFAFIIRVLDDWNLGKKSGNWQRQKALQKLQFDYDVEAFFTVNVVSSSENHAQNTTFDKAVLIRVRCVTFENIMPFYYDMKNCFLKECISFDMIKWVLCSFVKLIIVSGQ